MSTATTVSQRLRTPLALAEVLALPSSRIVVEVTEDGSFARKHEQID